MERKIVKEENTECLPHNYVAPTWPPSVYFAVLASVFGRRRSRALKTTATSKRFKHEAPSKKNWIYSSPQLHAQNVGRLPYSPAYYQELARRTPQANPVASSAGYVQGNQRRATNAVLNVVPKQLKQGAVNPALSTPGVSKIAQHSAGVKKSATVSKQLNQKPLRG